jgi:hypothetical protein
MCRQDATQHFYVTSVEGGFIEVQVSGTSDKEKN